MRYLDEKYIDTFKDPWYNDTIEVFVNPSPAELRSLPNREEGYRFFIPPGSKDIYVFGVRFMHDSVIDYLSPDLNTRPSLVTWRGEIVPSEKKILIDKKHHADVVKRNPWIQRNLKGYVIQDEAWEDEVYGVVESVQQTERFATALNLREPFSNEKSYVELFVNPSRGEMIEAQVDGEIRGIVAPDGNLYIASDPTNERFLIHVDIIRALQEEGIVSDRIDPESFYWAHKSLKFFLAVVSFNGKEFFLSESYSAGAVSADYWKKLVPQLRQYKHSFEDVNPHLNLNYTLAGDYVLPIQEALRPQDQQEILDLEADIIDLKRDMIDANDQEKEDLKQRIDDVKAQIDDIKQSAAESVQEKFYSSGALGSNYFEVFVNPDFRELRSIPSFQGAHQTRAFITWEGDAYVFDAEILHLEAARHVENKIHLSNVAANITILWDEGVIFCPPKSVDHVLTSPWIKQHCSGFAVGNTLVEKFATAFVDPLDNDYVEVFENPSKKELSSIGSFPGFRWIIDSRGKFYAFSSETLHFRAARELGISEYDASGFANMVMKEIFLYEAYRDPVYELLIGNDWVQQNMSKFEVLDADTMKLQGRIP